MTEQMKIRKERMIELRKQGMTYEEIAKEVGMSRQRVYQIIGGNYRRHRKFKEDEIVYAGLRNWMNEHDMGWAQLVRSIYGYYHPELYVRVKSVMSGKNCRKDYIDRVLFATGLTYEQAFGGANDDKSETDR